MVIATKIIRFIFPVGVIILAGALTTFGSVDTRTIIIPDHPPQINLVRNGGFEKWKNPRIPEDWNYKHIYDSPIVFSKNTHAFLGNSSVSIANNSVGEHLLYQIIPVEQNTVYTSQVIFSSINHDFRYGGLIIRGVEDTSNKSLWVKIKSWLWNYDLDPFIPKVVRKIAKVLSIDPPPHPASGPLLGYHLYSYSTNGFDKILKTDFNTRSFKKVAVFLGFEEGINANVSFDSVMVYKGRNKFDYKPAIDQKEIFSIQTKVKKLTQDNFDEQMRNLMGFVNSKLLTRDRSRLDYFHSMKEILPTYFKMYLSSPLGHEGASYCQRSSLSLSEIMGIFGVKSKQWHCTDKNGGFHQFIEYYNPYSKRWIVMDPLYGIQFKDQENTLMSVSEVKMKVEEGSFHEDLVLRIPKKYLSYNWEQIRTAWQSTLVGGIGFPHDKVMGLSYPAEG